MPNNQKVKGPLDTFGLVVTVVGGVAALLIAVVGLPFPQRLAGVFAAITLVCALFTGRKLWQIIEIRNEDVPPEKRVPSFIYLFEKRPGLLISGVLLSTLFGVSLLAFLFPEALEAVLSTATNTSTPTVIVTNGPIECQSGAGDELFTEVLLQDGELERALGHPKLPQPICVWGAYQTFDGGLMIWRADSVDIYVLSTNGSVWTTFKDSWEPDKDDELSCESDPPEDHFQPIYGFGKVWCDNQRVRDDLGFATMKEVNHDLLLQSFDRGWLILTGDTIYALVLKAAGEVSGNWKNIEQHITIYQEVSLDALQCAKPSSVETNLERPPSHSDSISGIRFDTRWGVPTRCFHAPNCSTRLLLLEDTSISNPVSVHLLLNAGGGFIRYAGEQIGTVHLDFSDGSSFPTPLILGFNIRDWRRDNPEAVTTVTSPDSQLAWRGKSPQREKGQVDILTIDIPSSHLQSTLESIQVLDVLPGLDPCVQLLAVTVKKHWP